jgi:hypothetical protein
MVFTAVGGCQPLREPAWCASVGAGSGPCPKNSSTSASKGSLQQQPHGQSGDLLKDQGQVTSDTNSSSISARVRSMGDTRPATGVGPPSCFRRFEETYACRAFTPGTGRSLAPALQEFFGSAAGLSAADVGRPGRPTFRPLAVVTSPTATPCGMAAEFREALEANHSYRAALWTDLLAFRGVPLTLAALVALPRHGRRLSQSSPSSSRLWSARWCGIRGGQAEWTDGRSKR